ncbi:MAG: prenyltransferase [Candidatus Omnitrophica bacterium]|nr:prenyltransferase [Candidatus Omnitrophota bacterium]
MQTKSPLGLAVLARAFRIPFLGASILPFVFGSLLSRQALHPVIFVLGLCAVIFTHLGANLINDYADSQNTADWKDKKFYGLFGGSKLIQEGILSESFYLFSSIVFLFLALFSVVSLCFIIKSFLPFLVFILIALLGAGYSLPPLKFSCRQTGEVVIFFLFGPALVMGGYFLQTGIFPSLKAFFLSVPFGLLTSAILLANEVPDYPQDKEARKYTWVNFLQPRRAFILYAALAGLSVIFIVCAVAIGYLKISALAVLLFLPMVFKATKILKVDYASKQLLLRSSALTIKFNAVVSLILIAALFSPNP